MPNAAVIYVNQMQLNKKLHTKEEWAQILFADVSRYSLNTDWHVLIRIEEGTSKLSYLVCEISRFHDRGTMI